MANDIKTIFQSLIDCNLIEDRREYTIGDLEKAYRLEFDDARELYWMIFQYFQPIKPSPINEEKIRREYAMIARDLDGLREAHLMRIIRNKRLPIFERFAAILAYEGAEWDLIDYQSGKPLDSPRLSLQDDCSDERLLKEISLFLHEIDRPAQ